MSATLVDAGCVMRQQVLRVESLASVCLSLCLAACTSAGLAAGEQDSGVVADGGEVAGGAPLGRWSVHVLPQPPVAAAKVQLQPAEAMPALATPQTVWFLRQAVAPPAQTLQQSWQMSQTAAAALAERAANPLGELAAGLQHHVAMLQPPQPTVAQAEAAWDFLGEALGQAAIHYAVAKAQRDIVLWSAMRQASEAVFAQDGAQPLAIEPLLLDPDAPTPDPIERDGAAPESTRL